MVQVQRGSTPESGKATYWFTKATQGDPGDPDYFFNLGYAYWLEQDLQAAIYWLREAVRRDPADADSHFVLGSALKATGSVTEGERELELARRLSATYETADRRAGVPRGLERLQVRRSMPLNARRADVVLVQAEQRDQRELARVSSRPRPSLLREGVAIATPSPNCSACSTSRRIWPRRTCCSAGRISAAAGPPTRSTRSRSRCGARRPRPRTSRWRRPTSKDHRPDEARREAERALALDPQSSAAKSLLDTLPTPLIRAVPHGGKLAPAPNHTMSDEGFHEIQLNGKQLVFLFMAATVVSVVIFLCGVMVGRGVRAERGGGRSGRADALRGSSRRPVRAGAAAAGDRPLEPRRRPRRPPARNRRRPRKTTSTAT